MHKLPSSHTLRRFKFAALLVLLMFVMLPVAVGFAIGGVMLEEKRWFIFAGICVGVTLLCLAVNFILSGRLRCPLCMVPPMQNRGCSKHRTATTMLGSHRLKVASSIIFKDSFRCPYCGEPTSMEVRQRGGR